MGYSQDLGKHAVRTRDGDVLYRAEGFHDPPTDQERAAQDSIASGSSFELFCGVVAAVVAVIGVSGYYPIYMAAVATIAIGFALIAQGGTLAARWQAPHKTEPAEAIGIGTEVIGGFAGIALGAMVLLGVSPWVLLPVAIIVVGAALLFGGPAEPQLADAAPRARQPFRVTRDTLRTASSVMVMGGLAGIVLGILALTLDGYTLVLANIGALCVAGALVVAGGAVAARFGRRFA
jgi:hypothetical protein